MVEPGSIDVLVGTSSADLEVAGSFTVVPDTDGRPVVKQFDGSSTVTPSSLKLSIHAPRPMGKTSNGTSQPDPRDHPQDAGRDRTDDDRPVQPPFAGQCPSQGEDGRHPGHQREHQDDAGQGKDQWHEYGEQRQARRGRHQAGDECRDPGHDQRGENDERPAAQGSP